MLLHDTRTHAANQAIEALGTTREKRANELEAFRLALVTFLGKDLDLDQVLAFLEKPLPQLEREMILIYLERQPLPPEIDRDVLAASMDTPPDVKAIVTAYANARDDRRPHSNDPARYWKSGKFQALPVSDDEKAAIRKREERWLKNEDMKEAFHLVKNVVTLLNASNGRRDMPTISPGALRGETLWITPFVSYTYVDPMKPGSLDNPAIYFVREDRFFVPHEGHDYVAFDECPLPKKSVRIDVGAPQYFEEWT